MRHQHRRIWKEQIESFPLVCNFSIGGSILKLGTPLYSIGTAAVEKNKMLEVFREQWASARLEGVFWGKGANKKYRVKWTNLGEDL